jgi:hypothetical protein
VKKRPRSTGAKRRAFGRFRKNRTIFSLGDAAGGLSLWFVSLSAVRKRNEHHAARPAVRKRNEHHAARKKRKTKKLKKKKKEK